MADAAAHAHGEHHDHTKHYVKIWAILLVLLVISILGPELGNQAITLFTAFGIAVVKAGMVVYYFMHAGDEPKYVHYFITTALAFMFLFFFAVAPDVMRHEGTNWRNDAAKEFIASEMAKHEGEHTGHDKGTSSGGAHH